MENKICQYEGCDEPVNAPHHEFLCVFHGPVEKKGITVEEFNQLIWQRISSEGLNFRGFIFPGDIVFRGKCRKVGGPIVFPRDVDFSGAQFAGDADFRNVHFERAATFNNATFSNHISFQETRFTRIARFIGARFDVSAYFGNAEFSQAAYFNKASMKEVDFRGTQFLREAYFWKTSVEEDAYFETAKFKDLANFNAAEFTGRASFHATEFSGSCDFQDCQFLSSVTFKGAHFDLDVLFQDNHIGGKLIFEEISLGDTCRFYFKSPIFKLEQLKNTEERIMIIFMHVRFKPFYSFFEWIQEQNIQGKAERTVFIFRYCDLKDVYFTNNDMTVFSFYKSSFDEARFISSRWSEEKDKIWFIPFRRKNIIPEENFLSCSLDKDEFKVGDLNGYEDVASLYRRMKTALDNTKDYQQASWFYFNEFEMKRRALKEEIESHPSKIRKIFSKILSKYFLYFSYKVFAGYGEKPLWSAIWFFIFSSLFAVAHMLNGIEKINGDAQDINYSISQFISAANTAQFWNDLLVSWFFALSRLIPANYVSSNVTKFYAIGDYGNLISFLNFAFLFIMATFIFIGLKRHFRRF
jgi:uncharacterized protein YjbI with pentapeptide repeats